MIPKNFVPGVAALVLFSAFAINANAASFVFNFSGECDDCAFSGNPSDPGFDPLNDGMTQSVSATLRLPNVVINPDGLLEWRGESVGQPSFSYHGSSLINPFTISDPYLFTNALLPNGAVRDGLEFTMASSQNYTLPGPPGDYSFPNFCTAIGEEVLGSGCIEIGLVSFSLDSTGDWFIFGIGPSDVGSGGQFSPAGSVPAVPVPAAVWLFGSGMLGLMGLVRRRKSV